MYFLSISCCNCDFSSVSSIMFIRYGAFYAGIALGIRSILKSISLFGGSPWTYSGKISSNSFKTGVSSSLGFISFSLSFVRYTVNTLHHFLTDLFICRAYIFSDGYLPRNSFHFYIISIIINTCKCFIKIV